MKKKNIFLIFIILPLIMFGLFYFSSKEVSEVFEVFKKVLQKTPEISENEPALLASITIHLGKTISESLLSAGLSSQQTYSLTQALKPLFNPKESKPGDLLNLKKSPDGHIIFEYFPNSLEYYLVEESEDGSFSAFKKEHLRHKVIIGVKTSLQSSVYESMRKEGLAPELINDFAKIFEGEIDFFTEPQKGDTFELIWERYLSVEVEGKILMEGKILAAQYINSKKTYAAILFKDENNYSDYYTPEGNSLRRFFLRSPLNYTRISSYFSYNRFHPILRTYRPHLGIDYAAPRGTPISTVADGTVTFAGWKGGFGRFIQIKHSNGIATSYGHLSGFAKGIKKGKKVKQGQIIGYVGATGLATGPHLDFRITKNGKYVNFLKEKFPPASSIKSTDSDKFKEISQKYEAQLKTLLEHPENIYIFPSDSF